MNPHRTNLRRQEYPETPDQWLYGAGYRSKNQHYSDPITHLQSRWRGRAQRRLYTQQRVMNAHPSLRALREIVPRHAGTRSPPPPRRPRLVAVRNNNFYELGAPRPRPRRRARKLSGRVTLR